MPGAGWFVCELAFCLGWIYRHLAPCTPLLICLVFGPFINGLVWILPLAFFKVAHSAKVDERLAFLVTSALNS